VHAASARQDGVERSASSRDRRGTIVHPRGTRRCSRRPHVGHTPISRGAPAHPRARQLLGPNVVIAPEHKVVLETDPDLARAIGRPFVSDPYLKLRNYTNNLRRYGYTDDDIARGGSDRLIDALALHGSADKIAAGLRAHFDAGADHVAVQVLTPTLPNREPLASSLA
jgi:probable F420-dependent oxidoreductase